MTGIKGKVVLITGASSGIGAATARALAKRGANVMLCARREERLQHLKAEIESAGGIAEYQVVDVTSRQQVHEAAANTIREFGGIDVLFTNAGIMPLSFMKNLHLDEWDQMINVNIKGVLHGISAVLPHMIERNTGHIISTCSIAGHIIFPGSAVYSGTKFAVWAIIEGLRKELHPETKIRVTQISPGAVATELANHITEPVIKENFGKRQLTPLSGESIANAVVYAIEQPDNVDVNEIIIRPVSQPH